MRQKDVIDRPGGQAVVGQRREQMRHREIRAGVDEGGAAIRDEQMTRIHARSQVLGVDGQYLHDLKAPWATLLPSAVAVP